jgi:hypothetical protein
MMGDADQHGNGNWLLIDGNTFAITGKWTDQDLRFGYDFW